MGRMWLCGRFGPAGAFGMVCLLTAAGESLAGPGDPWADRVIRYVPGSRPVPGYTNPLTAIGSPERFTGEGQFPSVVSVFSPPFGVDEIVSIGEGGSLVMEFDEPILDDPGHPFGVDLIAFGNGGFVDVEFPNGRVGTPPQTFGVDAMRVLISADAVNWFDLGEFAEGFFPTQGYLDGGPYDPRPGRVPSDFTRPVNPALRLGDFSGATYNRVLELYAGSGGGTPIDIGPSGLRAVRFVRIDVLDDGDPNTDLNAEIDAFATVPEPGARMLPLALAVVTFAFRRG